MSDPEELDPEVDVDLSADIDDDEDDIPEGFVVEGVDDAEPDDDEDDAGDDDVGDDGDDDEGSTRAAEHVGDASDDSDEFADDVAPVVRVPEEEDDAPARQSGEFVCRTCFLVKKESQLAIRSRKVCRDCA